MSASMPKKKKNTKHKFDGHFVNEWLNTLIEISTVDAEKASIEYDAFAARKNEHPTTDRETLVHLIKASIGIGILAMPYVFAISGFIPALFATLVTSLISAHCNYILVKCAHILYKRTKTPSMTFADVAEAAFATGPVRTRGLSIFARYFVMISMFVTYFGTCAVAVIVMAENTQQMYAYYTDNLISIRICILLLLLPLMLLSTIRSLKFLTPVSMLANVCMAIGLAATIYYLLQHLPDLEQRRMANDVTSIPSVIAITIFAFNVIGIIMPLENQMKTPKHFIGFFGVLSQGMTIVTILYIIFGILGYWCYGMDTDENITLNLPVDNRSAQIVKISVLLNCLLSYSLQIYVCVECVWNAIKHRFGKRELMANYIFRLSIVISAVMLAVLMPSLGPLMKLIGAFGFSMLGLIFPVIIEMITCWSSGYGRYSWILYKNIICISFGLFSLVFGTVSAVIEIFDKFSI